MEQQLYLMLLGLTSVMFILSLIKGKNITIRLISALLLYASSVIMLYEPFMYVGFGSMNVITYINSQAGDPSRQGEVGFAKILEALAYMQFFLTVLIFFDWLNYKMKIWYGHMTPEGMVRGSPDANDDYYDEAMT